MITGLALSALLFLSAGRLDWLNGWIFVVLWFAPKICHTLVIGRRDPGLIAERASQPAGQKAWDKIILTIYLVFSVATIVVAGLDGSHSGWSGAIALFLPVTGAAIYIAAYALFFWASWVNTFLSRVSRVQEDRNHRVVTSGPYQYLRHPTYLATVLLWIVTPLILESWWALIPGGLAGVMMIIRTALEDRMLYEELPGYAEYTKRVPFRLVPGLW
jgi:protein-S-isoprenylcysteine O-methyltransferase Ste14